MKPNFLMIGAVAVVGYLLLKPKTAAAAPRSGTVTTTARPVNTTVALVSAVAAPLVSWLTTTPSHYTDTSPNVVAPEGWT